MIQYYSERGKDIVGHGVFRYRLKHILDNPNNLPTVKRNSRRHLKLKALNKKFILIN